MDAAAQPNFVRSRLPWLVAVGALVVYLFTLNRWISLNSLYVTGLFQEPPYGTPLLYLLSLPLRIFPGNGALIAFNALSALCAALTLGLLARSIALLPHDRTREQRRRETGAFGMLTLGLAWVPPLLAAIVLGTQLTFWEHATAATGEMLDLLLFAYVIRCLLEYRIDQRESWLVRMAFVYGLATTNNWAMIGFFPLALAALIWIRGAAFFRARFVLRLTLWGLAGLLLYLLMPLIHVLQEDSAVTFWEALRLQLAFQRRILLSMPRLVTLFASLTSLLPLAIMSVRWPSNVGDTSAVGNILYNYIFRLMFGVFLGFGLWMMLDPAWSPRALLDRRVAAAAESVVTPSYLSFYYLAAIALGYFIGYFLLVLGQPEPHRHRRTRASAALPGKVMAAITTLAALAVGLLLVWRNAPVVRDNNGLMLKEYAQSCLAELPSETAVVFADTSQLFAVVRLMHTRAAEPSPHLLVNTVYMPFTAYQRELYRQAPDVWPDFVNEPNLTPTTRLPDAFLQFEVKAIADQVPSYYLHPSFGFYFESLFLEPRNLIFRVQSFPTNLVAPPRLTSELMTANNAYWNELWPRLQQVVAGVQRGSTDARMVGRWYSLGLNHWAATLQRNAPEQWDTAAVFFERAQLLNPDNVSAAINLEYNRSRQAGRPPRARSSGASPTEYFGPKYRTWSDVIRINGPIDDPHFLLELGAQFQSESLHRQAALQFLRVLELTPESNQARLGLAQAYVAGGWYDLVLDVVDNASDESNPYPFSLEEQIELHRLEALAFRGLGQNQEAERTLLSALQTHGRDPGASVLVNTLVDLYVATERGDEAIALVDAHLPQTHAAAIESMLLVKARLLMLLGRFDEADAPLRQVLARNPDHPQALVTQGALYIQMEQFNDALPPLNRLLDVAPRHVAGRLNRAIAHLQTGNLAQARQDYLRLLDEMRRPPFAIYFGLGEIAWREKNFEEAREHYEAYLRTAPPESPEAQEVARRLETIRTAKP